MSEKRKHPILVPTRRWWMQHYLKVQYLSARNTSINPTKVATREEPLQHSTNNSRIGSTS
eukprot:8019340-Prorocentrum_lima.AAC.1